MMLKKLFLTSVLLLPNVALAQDYTDDDGGAYVSILIDKKYLTPEERGQIAVIEARAEQREEQQQARKLARAKEEAARRQQCTLALLWIEIGCPAKEGAGS